PKLGLTTNDHAQVAYDAWAGGCDFVKDDENLSSQRFNPFEERVVKTLIDAGDIVITVGGGGIPVVADENGLLKGVAAVIDKDFASSLLANRLGAELFIVSTAVEKVALNFGKPDEQWVDEMSLAEAKQYLAEGTHFANGSMAPKIEAIINFLENGGKWAIVTNPQNLERALAGETGTHFRP
ncbi:MAG: RuBisCO large subunit C-terminal-like domain-containing protein, partial [Candidatus Promineifilaceae bacterium]